MKIVKGLFSASLGACVLVGCASAPESQLRDTQAAVRAAEEVGAPTEPQASLHLKLAKEQLGQAMALIEEDEMKKAKHTLDRAELDAELAIAIARKAAVKNEAQRAWNEVQQLRAEFE